MYLDDKQLDSGALGRRILADPLVSSELAGKVANPGAWTSYVPSLTASTTNPNIGASGSATGAYVQLGNTVHFRVKITFNGVGLSAGSGTYRVSLPVTAATSGNLRIIGHGHIYDISLADLWNVSCVQAAATYVQMYIDSATNFGLVTESAPIPWSANDEILLTGTFEVA